MPFIEQPLTIWTAAKKGLLAEVQRFVSEGISVDAKNRGDVTPLHEAAYSGHTQIIQWLLDNGATINTRTVAERGYPGAETPLYMAVEMRQLEAVRLLLSRGADTNLKSSDGASALDTAAADGRLDIVTLLVESGARVNGRGESNPLLSALCGCHLEVARYFVSRGARTDTKVPPFGGSLLNLLAGCKWRPGVEFLLSLGLDVNGQDDVGSTPLHAAVLSFGCRKSETVKTGSGERFMVTERQEDALPIVECLLDAGASVSVRNNDGYTALDYAKKMRAKVLIDLLCSARIS